MEKFSVVTAPRGLIEGHPPRLTEAFKLHSKLEAKLNIILDFDGRTEREQQRHHEWRGAASTYKVDSDPAITNTELKNIQAFWRPFTVDQAPLDADATTEILLQSAISSIAGVPTFASLSLKKTTRTIVDTIATVTAPSVRQWNTYRNKRQS